MKTLQKDLTTGNPGKIIFNFTLPIFIGNVFQQFYSMADTIIVGKFVGTKALAAVGSTGTIMFLINGFILGMTAGFTVLTAQKFGAGDMKAMRKTVGNAAILAIIMSLIMTVFGMMAMKPLLGIMQTPDDIFKDAYAYIMVICGGIAAQMLYNFLSSVLRALGNREVFPDSYIYLILFFIAAYCNCSSSFAAARSSSTFCTEASVSSIFDARSVISALRLVRS